ncbi:MAG: hypothetical protein ACD_63C00113G0001, partial [uncultured bacterium]
KCVRTNSRILHHIGKVILGAGFSLFFSFVVIFMLDKRYNYKERDMYWQKFWIDQKVFAFDEKSDKPIYSIDTPPPTISGLMHVGHAFGYMQHDFIARYHRMKGENIFYPFGTDDNGLPTQRLIQKMKKVRAVDLGRDKFTKLCLDTLKKELRPKYIFGWQTTGLSCDWNIRYSTIDKHSRRLSQKSFIELYKMGRAYRKKAPAIFCTECRTAISQVELKDIEIESNFNDIVFKADGKDLIIATTRPELLPAAVAVFYNPKDKRYKNLKNKKAKVPIFDFEVPIFEDDRVDIEVGTGAVMCCTFGDQTDMEWQKAFGLPIKQAIGMDGKMTEIAGEYSGMKVLAAREKILQDFKNKNLLKNQKKIKHVVNVHERCDKEVEYINSKQWFIKYLDLRDKMLEWGRQLNWHPKYMRNRYENWVNGLAWDWCISRQIYFGIPFPIWYCESCGRIILADKEELPVDPLIDKPPVEKCPKCKKNKFVPEKDIINTWATSSLTPQIAAALVDKKLYNKIFPMSLRPQGQDIITFWLFNTIVKSQLHEHKMPWKDVIINGWGLDKHGKKMSKSKGNIVEPDKVYEKYGVDAFRFWAGSAALGSNHAFKDEEVATGKRVVTKLWNAAKFCMSHLEKFEQDKDVQLEPVDKWILSRLANTIETATEKFENYGYSAALDATERFFWHDFADRYMEFVKYRLYGEDEKSKESARQTLYICFLNILKLYAPILSHVTEEIYQTFFKKFLDERSVHVCAWPKAEKNWKASEKFLKEFELVLKLIDEIKKYKSENGLSMGKEIENYKFQSPNFKKLSEEDLRFVKQVMRVKNVRY